MGFFGNFANELVSFSNSTCVHVKKLTLPTRAFQKVVFVKIKIFFLICGASKGFMKAFKASVKPFEATQRSLKIMFCLRPGLGWEC